MSLKSSLECGVTYSIAPRYGNNSFSLRLSDISDFPRGEAVPYDDVMRKYPFMKFSNGAEIVRSDNWIDVIETFWSVKIFKKNLMIKKNLNSDRE